MDFDVVDDGSNNRQKVVTLIEQMDDSNRILTPKKNLTRTYWNHLKIQDAGI
ncbi:MAG: hypothetical protein H6602_14205 [Flavobacteriales bacterium]|nr:hypothetical protein [Flavobacteriales bacterium]